MRYCKQLACIYILFVSFASFAASPGDGWSFIRQNDNKSARNAFIEVLAGDSVNLPALKGMVYLSEIEQDKLAFQNYINTIINNYKDENFYSLFPDVYRGTGESVIRQSTYSERTRLASKIQAAAKLKEKRQFAQSDKAYKELFTDYGWSFLGPFKNISGSGHMVVNTVETEAYEVSKKYRNHKGTDLSWVKPKYMNVNGKIDLDDYLPGASTGVYYANAFVEATEQTTVQVRISRSSPVKIWLDDALIFENKDAIEFSWDNEIAELTIAPGTHRLLLKLSTPGSSPKSYDLLSFFDKNSSSDYSDIGVDFSDMYSFLDGFNSDEKSFALRITDKNGVIKTKLKPASVTTYTPRKYDVLVTTQPVINYYHKQIEADPSELFNYYALCKAYLNAGMATQAEEFFVRALHKNKEPVFFKYLAAKIYAQNGKIEKAYETLNDINQDRSPVFGLLYEKFDEIDLNNEEQKYLTALEKLKSITPSNYSVIRAYLKYYDKKGMQKEKEDFIKEMKKTYPGYASNLDYELSLAGNKPDKDQTDKEKDKETQDAIKKLKSRFITYDYTTAISYYKGKDKTKKVLELYDELIRILPYNISYRKGKSRFLYAEGRYDEAQNELNEVLKIAPYDDSAMEQMGDIYGDMDKTKMENQQKALEYYYRARRLGEGYDLQNKIDKIEGQKTRKNLFTTKTFDDVLNDTLWQKKYPKEESVVLMYTRDLVYDSLAKVDIYQQIMIKILNEAGAKKWTEFDFSFLGTLNTVKVIKSNGAEVVPDKRGGYVVFKNLEPGDVIEIDGVYKWKQQTELGQEFSLIHYVSFDAPIYYKKYEVAVPKGIYLGHLTHKLSDNVIKSSRNEFDFYLWEYHDLPKIENEGALLDAYDLYSTIMVSTMPDWSQVVEWYQHETYRKLEPGYEIREVLDSIVKPGMSKEEQVIAIYNYITKRIKYSYVSFLQSGYVPKNAGLTLASNIGDCKDVATLMIVMLRELGIESYYTLVKTNQFNHQEMLPSLYFDHVIVQYIIGGKEKYLDLTTDFYPHYVLTENDINAFGLVIKQGETKLIRLPSDDLDSTKNKVEYTITANLETNRSVSIRAKAIYPGIAGGNFREVLSTISESEQKNYIIDNMLGKGALQNLNLIDHSFQNINEISSPLLSAYQLNAPDFSDEVANLLICRIPYMTGIQSSPAISSKKRNNRLNVEALGKVEPTLQKVTIVFPKGYKLLMLPKDVNVVSRFGTYRVAYKKTNDGIYVEKYQSFNTRIVEEKEFAEFKAYYLRLLDLDKTKIAIQKL